MMDQKTLLAIFFSIAIIFIWTLLFPPPEQQLPRQEGVVAEEEKMTPAPQPAQDSMTPTLTLPTQEDDELAKEIVIETDYYRAIIDTRGAVLTSLLLKNYEHSKERITLAEWLPLETILGGNKPLVETPNNQVQMIKKDLVSKSQDKDNKCALPNYEIFQTLGIDFTNQANLSEIFQKVVYSSDHDQIEIPENGTPQTLTLSSPVREGIQIVKTLRFHPSDFIIEYQVNLINRGQTVMPLNVGYIFGEGHVMNLGPGQSAHVGPVYVYDGEIETIDTSDLASTPSRIAQMEWLGIEDAYFITAATPLSQINQGYFKAPQPPDVSGCELKPLFGITLNIPSKPVELKPNKPVKSSFKLYFGPKDETQMLEFGHNLSLSHDLTLEILAKPLLKVLIWIHSYVGNYGVAIILLTVLVRVILFPLTYKGSKSMKRMQQLQPKMLKLREKYKNNKEKLNAEMMALYKKNKVNPMGGCLPILLQLPIFFALYSALSTAVELRHAPFFGWITDLSAPDGLGILPILMGLTMYLIQKMTPTGMMDPMQAKIMGMLPIVFTVFTFTFPAGLTLYWTTSNILSLGQQYIINRIKLPDLVEED